MRKPLAIDLYAGLGGWTDGLLAEGYDVVGFDIERHRYPAIIKPDWSGDHVKCQGQKNGEEYAMTRGPQPKIDYRSPMQEYPARLVLQDVLTIHGSQFRNAALIVASPPCQAYSYMAMPWKLAKAKAAAIRADTTGKMLADLNALFHACFRIQREACEAAGRCIPLVVENVKGAQPWVGPAKANFGSFYLWGDVAMVGKRVVCGSEFGRYTQPIRSRKPDDLPELNRHDDPRRGRQTKNGSWFAMGADGKSNLGDVALKVLGFNFHEFEKTGKPGGSFQTAAVGVKNGKDWFGAGENCSLQRQASSGSSARKAASAQIAKIPLELSRYVARCYKPKTPILDMESA